MLQEYILNVAIQNEMKRYLNQKRLVCLCNQVSALEIKKSLRAGALSTSEIQNFTSAGTCCGRCIKEIDSLVLNHKMETKKDEQFRINFDE